MIHNRLHLESVVSPRPDVLSQQVRGETVLLDLDAEQYYALNETGSRIWSLLSQRLTLLDICNRLCERYPVERARIERDVLEIMDELVNAALVEIREGKHDA